MLRFKEQKRRRKICFISGVEFYTPLVQVVSMGHLTQLPLMNLAYITMPLLFQISDVFQIKQECSNASWFCPLRARHTVPQTCPVI